MSIGSFIKSLGLSAAFLTITSGAIANEAPKLSEEDVAKISAALDRVDASIDRLAKQQYSGSSEVCRLVFNDEVHRWETDWQGADANKVNLEKYARDLDADFGNLPGTHDVECSNDPPKGPFKAAEVSYDGPAEGAIFAPTLPSFQPK